MTLRKKYPLALHIFRRDLRLHDNTALHEALTLSEYVIPCFILDKRQIENNPFKSDHCIQFMKNSLYELDNELRTKKSKLFIFYGIAEDVVSQLITKLSVKAVFVNRDYTPFSLKRDDKINKICQQSNVGFHVYADALLHEPEEIQKPNHEPYTIFSYFLNKALEFPVQTIKKNSQENYYQKSISFEDKQALNKIVKNPNSNLAVKGGRTEAVSLLKKIKNLKDYEDTRNFPALDSTTLLSAHNKFGTLSIRELYYFIANQFTNKHVLITELHWRDFFTHIGFHFPHVFGGAFHKKFETIDWEFNKAKFHAWCQGETGFPIVDAGMRELNTTGFMHNRVRMIVGSFLTKDLHIDWRLGEKYFAEKLVDYDPAVNNGNWQWVASTGCDAQPYFRIFNPWLQQAKFDPDCIYIKRWVPELERVPTKILHNLYKDKQKIVLDYPKPIVNHAIESSRAKEMYKKVF